MGKYLNNIDNSYNGLFISYLSQEFQGVQFPRKDLRVVHMKIDKLTPWVALGLLLFLSLSYYNGESMVIESIIDTTMIGKVVKPIKFGNYDAIIPEVEGTAYITGRNELLIDPEDPLNQGFILR